MIHAITRRRGHSEEGYILIGVMFLLALFVIAMAVAAPKIAADIQHDRDLETMERGKQYIRAIQLYYRKFNAYPPNLDALVKTNNIRFLRKKYIDPMTGKDDWKPIMFGQNKTPLAMGFFGQPLGGIGATPIAGTGPGGGGGLMPGQNPTGGLGGTSPTGGLLGSNPTSPGTGTNPAAGAGTGPGTSGTGTDQSGGGSGQTDSSGNSITNGQTFGGAGIVGVKPASPKQSILVYKKKNHYNEWEFTYSPAQDMPAMGGGNAGGIGQPVGLPPGSPTPTPTPTPSPSPTPQQPPQPQQ